MNLLKQATMQAKNSTLLVSTQLKANQAAFDCCCCCHNCCC